MLNMQKGYDVDYYLDATAKGRETYYTDPTATGCEPPGLWHGRGPAAAAEYAEIARILEDVLVEGHAAMLEFLAARAGHARKGHHGGGAGEWVDAPDWTSVQFLQHDSREHDPQLHVHGPTLNKAVCPVDGKVRA